MEPLSEQNLVKYFGKCNDSAVGNLHLSEVITILLGF